MALEKLRNPLPVVVVSLHPERKSLQSSLEQREQFGIYDNMIRMAVGIEDTDDLIEDLRQALETP